MNFFAPTHMYGEPDDFRCFVDRAHALGLGVILDVVYNHAGPVGNYLKEFSPRYFSDRYKTEWGEALNLDGESYERVREFVLANARYWIEEFHLDGLRLDATQSIFDASDSHLIAALAIRVRNAAGGRGTFIVGENEPQDARIIRPPARGGYGIDALYYNALCLLECWLREERGPEDARPYADHAARARESFNRRFCSVERGHLLDIVDCENGDDAGCRPNRLFAISLRHAVLDEPHWAAVVEKVRAELLTPVGLRSLSPGHPPFKPRYFGDLRARDAAYHQGTVWGWLIGPFIDAWLRVHPEDRAAARTCLAGLAEHLDHGCVGSINEIFDAEEPYTPRGCIAQAWSVAEALRCWVKTAGA